MLTQTLEPITEKRDLIQTIELLSDRAILQARGYIERLREEEREREIDEEIAALEAKYGTTPNAETIAALEEAEAGIGERTTVERIRAECDALRY